MPNDQSQPTLAAKRSFQDGHVAVGITLKVMGWGGGDSARISASTELTVEQARTLAQALVALADEAEAKVKRKEEAEARRQKWREREIAAGRMVVLKGLRG